jgi:hypothetical protein
MRIYLSSACAGVAVVVLAASLGCGGGSGNSDAKEVSHVQAITTLYVRASSLLRKKPASEEEFKQAFANEKLDLSVLGVGSLDELFVSDRDGQPIVVVYGSSSKGVAPGVVAYEQAGKDGIRLVGFNTGQIEEADDARFSQLVKGS